ncbi:T9SS type A sorting domain-containing protein [Flavobacterium sp. 25HG05S-40]|uniref:T9SS type A sorting domain-containing protein n=1 Tax=Flavobacterium sp. 25HG05S-40 TaxID=3458682 RepID=UPI004043CA47
MKKIYLLAILLTNIINAQIQLGNDLNGDAPGIYFGTATAISGDGTILAISAPEYNGNGNKKGVVKVYQYSNGLWNLYGNPIEGLSDLEYSGSSIALSNNGTVLAISSPQYYQNIPGENKGQVKVYQFNNGIWEQYGNPIIGLNDQYLGTAVALSADASRLAIGINGGGLVKVFTLQSGLWTSLGNDIIGATDDTFFGYNLDLSSDGSTIAITDFNITQMPDRIGKVKIYSFNSGNWSQKGASIDGVLSEDDVRKSVSLNSDGSTLAIGIAGSDLNNLNSGKVQVYKFVANNWSQQGNDIIGSGAEDEFTGYTVKLSADGLTLCVGSPGFNQQTGKATIYRYQNSSWSQVGNEFTGSEIISFLGSSFALSNNNILAISAIYKTVNNDVYSGQVKVFNVNSVLGTNDLNEERIKLYPNPAKNIFYIDGNNDLKFKVVTIYSITGQLIETYEINETNTNNINSLSKGIYFVELKGINNNKLIKKLIVE